MSPIDPALRIRSVHLAVSDLPRSVDFYERVLGLPPIAGEQGRARLGAGSRRRRPRRAWRARRTAACRCATPTASS